MLNHPDKRQGQHRVDPEPRAADAVAVPRSRPFLARERQPRWSRWRRSGRDGGLAGARATSKNGQRRLTLDGSSLQMARGQGPSLLPGARPATRRGQPRASAWTRLSSKRYRADGQFPTARLEPRHQEQKPWKNRRNALAFCANAAIIVPCHCLAHLRVGVTPFVWAH